MPCLTNSPCGGTGSRNARVITKYRPQVFIFFQYIEIVAGVRVGCCVRSTKRDYVNILEHLGTLPISINIHNNPSPPNYSTLFSEKCRKCKFRIKPAEWNSSRLRQSWILALAWRKDCVQMLSELGQDRRACSASIRDAVNTICDADLTHPRDECWQKTNTSKRS